MELKQDPHIRRMGGKSMHFGEWNRKIKPPDDDAMNMARARWDSIAKPLHGLGELEDVCIRIAGLTGSADISISKRAAVIFCADNGVTAEGVTQTDASVTAVMAAAMAGGRSCVCQMAGAAGADVFPVDTGMFHRVPGVRDLHVADGAGNIAAGPAMTEEQALQAVSAGISLAGELKGKGYQLLACGEMGIGNTTTAAAMASVLLGMPAEQTVGVGAGLSREGLARKQSVVRRAVAKNCPDPRNALDVLCKLGGFDIAGMTGLFLGGALYRIPVIIDGMISSVAALTAALLCPGSVCAMIPSHCSAEPSAAAILEKLSLEPILRGNFRLGEGTGAVCMMPLLDLALAVYNSAASFSDVRIPQYEPQGD